MFRLLFLLGGALFLTMLIGGQDRGQQRLGLMNHYAPPDIPASPAPAQAVVVLASLPAPQPAPEVAEAPPPPAAPVAVTAPAEPAPLPLRFVNTNAINVRQGPSTNDAVIGRLVRNEAVSLVADTGDGWYLIRVEGDGIEGFVAARLMTDRAP